jgi:thymidylate synthase ThyX
MNKGYEIKVLEFLLIFLLFFLLFISLRDDSHAQAEIQEYGRAIKQICKELFPWTMEAYENLK